MKTISHLKLFIASLIFTLTACGGGSNNSQEPESYTVTVNANAGGTATPTISTVATGETAIISIIADAGFSLQNATGCNGILSGNTYTTGTINENCTVTVNFLSDITPNNYTVNATAAPGGGITPPSIIVEEGDRADFNVSADIGFVIDTVSGCSGTLSGNTYTTAAVTGNCSVTATFRALAAPSVDAGVDQTVSESAGVTLSALANDADGTIESYSWAQLSGSTVTLTTANAASASFTAPNVSTTEVLEFEITVSDNNQLTAKDRVLITVEADNPVVVTPNVDVIAVTGSPALGFASDTTYESFSDFSIGNSGHIAFAGVASSASQDTNAIWGGLPDALQVILREDDPLPNISAGAAFLSVEESPIVASNGAIASLVNLKGSVTSGNDQSLIIYENNILHTIIQLGGVAPGYPPFATEPETPIAGELLVSDIIDYAFSDAGLVFSVEVSNRSAFASARALYLWDYNQLTLLASSDVFISSGRLYTPQLPDSILDILEGDCGIQRFYKPRINDNGEIVFLVQPRNRFSENITCPSRLTIAKWANGQFESVLVDAQTVQGLSNYEFEFDPGSSSIGVDFDIDASGNIVIYSVITSGPNIRREINWVVKADGSQEYLSIGGELMPGSSDLTMALLSGTTFLPNSDGNGNYVLIEHVENSTEQRYLLSGSPRVFPYSDISEVASSQLGLLAKVGDVPVGESEGIGISGFNVYPPSINAVGDIVFSVNTGLAYFNQQGALAMLTDRDSTVVIEGETINYTPIAFYFDPGLSGKPSHHGDNRQVIFQASWGDPFVNGFTDALMLTSPPN